MASTTSADALVLVPPVSGLFEPPPLPETLYHIRIVHPWNFWKRRVFAPERTTHTTSNSSSSPKKDNDFSTLLQEHQAAVNDSAALLQELQEELDSLHAEPVQSSQLDLRHSFFGLQLELIGTGTPKDAGMGMGMEDVDRPTRLTLRFPLRPHERRILNGLKGLEPFQLIVKSKLSIDSFSAEDCHTHVKSTISQEEDVKSSFNQVSNICVNNLILSVHTHQQNTISSMKNPIEIYELFEKLLLNASIARPIELKCQRHNHAEASAKIISFALREDVQEAQRLQQKDMLVKEEEEEEDESTKKKLCDLYQLDVQKEHYLYQQIGQVLKEQKKSLLTSGQWQAYEFDQVLWYFHVDTTKLYAEHPLRMELTTRQLLGQTLIRTRRAAFCLQKAFKRFLFFKQLTHQALTHLIEQIILPDLFKQGFDFIWQKEIIPFYEAIRPQVEGYIHTGIEEEAQEVLIRWRQMQKETRNYLKRQLEQQKVVATAAQAQAQTKHLPKTIIAKTIDVVQEQEMMVDTPIDNTYLSDEEDQWQKYLKILKSNLQVKKKKKKREKKSNSSSLLIQKEQKQEEKHGVKSQTHTTYRKYTRKTKTQVMLPQVPTVALRELVLIPPPEEKMITGSDPVTRMSLPLREDDDDDEFVNDDDDDDDEEEEEEEGTRGHGGGQSGEGGGSNNTLDTFQKYNVSIHIEKDIPIRPHGQSLSKQQQFSTGKKSSPPKNSSSSSSSSNSNSSSSSTTTETFDPFKSRLPPFSSSQFQATGDSIAATSPCSNNVPNQTQEYHNTAPRLPYIRRKK